MNSLYPYIDLHCDTLGLARRQKKRTLLELQGTMTDVKKLRAGGCLAQCFAIFLPSKDRIKKPESDYPGDEAYIAALHEIFLNTERECGDIFAAVRSAQDLSALEGSGKVGGILTMEDGRIKSVED